MVNLGFKRAHIETNASAPKLKFGINMPKGARQQRQKQRDKQSEAACDRTLEITNQRLLTAL